MKKLLYSFAILYALSLCQATSTDKLKVTVFFESLCPGCRYFILTHLYPVYLELESYLEIEVVPFQWCSEYEGKWTCRCQHGTDECLGNSYDSCALVNNTTKVALEFIHCLEQKKISDETFQLFVPPTTLAPPYLPKLHRCYWEGLWLQYV
ncbi:unnamed protein product [Acanthoscelides obtectus]|uniref:Gamma-interferon-inducible lysosomal thiol reductase n=1 Tax=Acanthoscelides obtectus TaxID=200917 RepID=A0A9P0LEY4_ACAOB|nr:unnamed protein product [Acanthoscelides obtectus]CAK1672469.1 Gamma-interferon-inducible lysosomal thiol reductase [Acanthoscelides obtectus]